MADATPRRWDSVAYGPVRSRRLGISLGLNLTPRRSKLCDFDCPYCACGFNTARAPDARWPSPDEVGHALLRMLERLERPPDWITFSGNGEPTLHPRFPVAVDRVLAIRDERVPAVRVAVLSNGRAAGEPRIRDALRRIEARIMKLDPGPPERVNGGGSDLAGIAAAYRALRPVTIQATVVRGPGWDGSSESSLATWLPLLVAADPATVQLCTLDRPPADPAIRNVSRERLHAMAAAIREALPRSIVDVF